jgi:adenosylcobinamide kinase/adenosylcobinamide-phosphate guanylyltransferase
MAALLFLHGPARSGKSRLAEHLAAGFGTNVLYLATLEALDDEMRARVAEHRAARPAYWRTLEEPLRLVGRLDAEPAYDCCLLDCLTLWVSNLLLAAEAEGRDGRAGVLDAVRSLLDWQASAASPLIVVSNEVGAGVVPEYALGRLYRDLLGEANQLVAEASDRLYHVVAGHYLELKSLGAQPVPRGSSG